MQKQAGVCTFPVVLVNSMVVHVLGNNLQHVPVSLVRHVKRLAQLEDSFQFFVEDAVRVATEKIDPKRMEENLKRDSAFYIAMKNKMMRYFSIFSVCFFSVIKEQCAGAGNTCPWWCKEKRPPAKPGTPTFRRSFPKCRL